MNIYQAGVPAVHSRIFRQSSHCAWLQPACLKDGCRYCGRMGARILVVRVNGVGEALQTARRNARRKVRKARCIMAFVFKVLLYLAIDIGESNTRRG